MSYGPSSNLSGGAAAGSRSPRSTRRVGGELPTVDRSPSRNYGGSPRKDSQHASAAGYYMGSPYYARDEDLGSPVMMDERSSRGHHRSRSASRPAMGGGGGGGGARYQSLDRAQDVHEREFMPIREPRERSLDRAARDRSLERGLYLEDELYGGGGGGRSARQSPNPHIMSGGGRDTSAYIGELQQQNNDLQRELGNFKKELELTNQKLGSSMHSIKTFWSPELKKERALRKEESAKYSLINDQLKLLNSENQKQAMLVRQLEEELRMRMRNPSVEMQQQMEVLFAENEHLTREIAILRETIKELELRIETQKQTLQARDESIKKLLEMLQNKGVGGKMLDGERETFESLQVRLIESEDRIRHYETLVRNRDQELCKTKRELKATNETLRALQMQLEKAFHSQSSSGPSNSTLTAILETKDARIATLEKEVSLLEHELDRLRETGARVSPLPELDKHDFSFKRQLDEFRAEIQRRDQEILAMSAKMKTLEEQHQDYQRHIAVLKESLCAKEEHYNMLQADVEELRQRLEEKNRHIEKKTLTATQATQERNRLNNELSELRDHMDIKDRKINVLQRKLDLQEANKKLANGAAKAGEETSALKMQLEEQKKQLEEQRRKLDEHKKGLDSKSRQLEEREKSIADADQKLKKRKEKLDQLEAHIQKNGGGRTGDMGEMQKKLEQELDAYRKELEKSRDDAQRSQVEMERLLQLVQMSQEEQNAKEKTIRDLQDALKNAQAKLRNQQAASAQMEEARKREEVEMQDKSVETEYSNINVNIQELQNGSRSTEKDLFESSNHENDTADIQELKDTIKKQEQKVTQLEEEVQTLEIALREHTNIAELEEMLVVVQQKDDRIEELEEALRESVRILSDRENVLHTEENRRKKIMEKVGKLEQRLLSLQTAHALRCSSCRPLVSRTQELERRLAHLVAERQKHLRDLSQMKQEALEAAISEKDAHLALLEVSGIKTARQAEEVEQLKVDRRRLMEKLKEENEEHMRLLQEYSMPDLGPPVSSIMDLCDTDDVSSNRHNGHTQQASEIDQDSLESPN